VESNKKLGIITRFRHGIKVCSKYAGEQTKKITPRIYGQTYYLMEKIPFFPQKSKKGNGRITGTKITPKEKYPVVKKSQNLPHKTHNN